MKYSCTIKFSFFPVKISWMKRFIAAIDKCRVRVPPSAFRARTSHPALSKMPSGKEKKYSKIENKCFVFKNHSASMYCGVELFCSWLHQLIQIPGIEYESAQAIAQR